MRVLVFATLAMVLAGCTTSAAQPAHPTVVSRICHGCDTPRRNLTSARSVAVIVKNYYQAINARHFRRAYGDIVPAGRPAFAGWKAGHSSLRYVDLRDLVGVTYRIRHGGETFACAGTRIIATNRAGGTASYGGFYLLERSQGRWRMYLPGSRMRQDGQMMVPSRSTCAAAIPHVSSNIPKELLDVSFADPSHGWLLGSPCNAEASCHRLTVAVTSDGGSTWSPLASLHAGPGFPPPAFSRSADNRAGSIRFADRRNGWVYGPALYATHNGGRGWTRIAVKGSISDVIPVGNSVWATDTRCASATCSITLIASDASANSWRALRRQPARYGAPIQLDRVDAAHSWLLYRTPGSGITPPHLVATANGGASWFSLPFPCGREVDFGARMAASDDRNLYLVCAGQMGMGQQFKEAFHSTDGGRHWSLVSSSGSGLNNLTASGYLSDLAVTAPRTALLALGRGTLVATTDGGRAWHAAIPQSRADPGGGGVGPLVFINPRDGWLVSFPYSLFRTTDGGKTWQELLGQGATP